MRDPDQVASRSSSDVVAAPRPARRRRQQRRRLARRRRPPTRRRASARRSSASTSSRPLHVAQAANRVMQDQAEGGSIVNIASVSGAAPVARHGRLRRRQGRAAQPHPDPRRRVGAEGAGERGVRRAGGHRRQPRPLRRRRRASAGWRPRFRSGRFATPADVADAVVFLASPLGGLRQRRQPRAARRRRVAGVPPRPPRAETAQPTTVAEVDGPVAGGRRQRWSDPLTDTSRRSSVAAPRAESDSSPRRAGPGDGDDEPASMRVRPPDVGRRSGRLGDVPAARRRCRPRRVADGRRTAVAIGAARCAAGPIAVEGRRARGRRARNTSSRPSPSKSPTVAVGRSGAADGRLDDRARPSPARTVQTHDRRAGTVEAPSCGRCSVDRRATSPGRSQHAVPTAAVAGRSADHRDASRPARSPARRPYEIVVGAARGRGRHQKMSSRPSPSKSPARPAREPPTSVLAPSRRRGSAAMERAVGGADTRRRIQARCRRSRRRAPTERRSTRIGPSPPAATTDVPALPSRATRARAVVAEGARRPALPVAGTGCDPAGPYGAR